MTLAGWEELQHPLEEEEEAPKKPGLADRILDALRAPVPRWAVLVAVVVTGMAVFVTLYLGAKGGLFTPQEPPQAAAIALPSPTPIPPTPTATPTYTPTPLPRLVVWAPGGKCAYVRPEPDGMMSEPLACIPNGTMVVDLGQRQQANGMEWARVQYIKEGFTSTGWMAIGAVAWDFFPNATTGDHETAFYDAEQTSIMRWLSPHTPVRVDHEEDGWAWVQLPNWEWGWVKSSDLK